MLQRVVTIPGVARKTAISLLAEIGADMSVFPSPAHLASWAGICPGNNASGGKPKPARTRHESVWLKTALTEAAQAAARTRGTHLAAHHAAIRGRGAPSKRLALPATTCSSPTGTSSTTMSSTGNSVPTGRGADTQPNTRPAAWSAGWRPSVTTCGSPTRPDTASRPGREWDSHFSGGLLRADAAVAARCAVIDAEKANYPIAFMCRLLRVPRSSFYAWANRVETPTQARRRTLAAAITAEFAASRQTSGCRRITAALNRAGIECSVGLVADLMRELGLAAVQPRAYKRTTVRGNAPVAAPDLLERDFTADAPGQRLVGDITYRRTGEGWLYLATVIDLATRMVVGWQTAAHMRTSLVIDAVTMARKHGRIRAGAVFHSDRGCQYTSAEFRQFCDRIKVRSSVGRTGVCWDNAAAESFFATLKNEMYYRQRFPTRARARFAVAEYIEVFYNRQRLHSTLGYRTPAEALTDHQLHDAA